MASETQAQAPRLDRPNLRSDLIAGLTFAIVNVPQAMGHALLAMVSPVLGIYALMVAAPVGALLTGSVWMNVSTTSALSVATGSALALLPADDRVAALAALVLLVGIIQVAAGLLKLGFVVRFVADSVMTGFLNGVAVLIILGQLSDLTGYRGPFGGTVARALDLLLRLNRIDVPTTLVGGLTLALIVLLLRTRLSRFAFIIAIGVSTALLAGLSRAALGWGPEWQTVRTVGDIASIPQRLPGLVLPAPRYLVEMLPAALSVAIIGLIQGAGVSQGFPNPDGQYPDVSRDFLGQGAANIAASLVGGVPTGGSISGTTLIVGAGARSRWTNILGGLFVAAIVLLAAPLVELVPMPALAALLIVAGFQGLRVESAVTIWNTSLFSRGIMVITFAATLFIPLQYAVLTGVALSSLLYVARQANQVIITQLVPVPDGFPEEQPAPKVLPSGQLTMLQVYGSLFFAAAKTLDEILPDPSDAHRAVVAIGLRGRPEAGSTFITILQRYAEALAAGGNRLMLVGVDKSLYDQLARTGALAAIGEENIFFATKQLGMAMNQAVEVAHAWLAADAGGGEPDHQSDSRLPLTGAAHPPA